MPESDAAKSDKYESRLTQAVEQLRGNVKWTLVAFGAIGTTLLAGSQLSNLGKFPYDEPRLWLALGCALAALGVAAYAVRSALAVAYTGYVEFSNLSDDDIAYVQRNPALLEGFGTIADLRDAYDAAIASRHDGFFAGLTLEQLQINENWYRYVDSLVDKVLSYVRYNRIRQQVERSRTELTVASVVTAAALVGFAWAANPGIEAQTVLLQSPASPAKLTLSTAGKVALTPLLGAKCVALPAIDVLLLNVTTTGSEVATVASKDCPLARFTLTGAMGKLASAAGPASATPALPVASAASERSIVWAQLRPEGDGAIGQLLARAIVARDAPCPALTVNGTNWPVSTRADGSDPDFPIKYCEAAVPGDATAMFGGVKLKPRPSAPRKIVVIGDTGCRITDYTAQHCDSAVDWPFFRIAKAASAIHPDLVIHVGDYHYREKPCAGRAGCADSPSGDNWRTWDAEFFTPAAPLLTETPWLMLRGNHEDCTRAGAGWNLLIRPVLGLRLGERCPVEADPGLFTFDKLHMIAPDTASAELEYGRENRVVTYRNHIRTLAKQLEALGGENWLLAHQALFVGYGWGGTVSRYDTEDMFGRIPTTIDKGLREDLCARLTGPVNSYRQWLAGMIPRENPNGTLKERPCAEGEIPADKMLAAPDISLIVSGDTHTFQMFAPDQVATKTPPLQLVVGTGGDVLESAEFPGADKDLVDATAKLFGVTGRLWIRHTFGFAVLERTSEGAPWTATLHDADGKAIVWCDLKRPSSGCK
jgi:hypothetical protein